MDRFRDDAKLQRFPMPPAWNAHRIACFVELAKPFCYFPRGLDVDIPVCLVGVDGSRKRRAAIDAAGMGSSRWFS
jgi:hypothetical protein